MFPTQYPTNVKDEVSVLFVRPAVFDGMRVQARKRAITKGTVMKYPPHLLHLYCGSFGNKAMRRKPTKGGMVEHIMKYLYECVRYSHQPILDMNNVHAQILPLASDKTYQNKIQD